MTFSFAKTAFAALILATGAAATASASTPGQSPAQSMGSRPVTYCGACLCTQSPPAMTAAGDWVPNGQLLGGSAVLKFRPRGQQVSAATVCNGPNS